MPAAASPLRPRLLLLPARAVASLAAGALAALGFCPIARAQEPPFAVSDVAVPGRPIWAFPVRVGAETARRFVVVSVEGNAPDEKRHLSAFGAKAGGGVAELGSIAVPGDVVVFDVADAAPGGGLAAALVAADRFELRELATGAKLAERAIDPPLPLPPRTRGLDRERMLEAWDGDGARSALVPALGGLAHVRLGSAPVQWLRVPLVTNYLTGDEDAGVNLGMLEARVYWPEIFRGDDDGDGRPDVFALSRYDVSVFRSGPDGLPRTPSRSVPLRPFTPEEELRFESSSTSLFARDVDGDGLTDLVLHRTFGTLLRSDATTTFFRNRGAGADPKAAPDARITGSGGFGSIFLEDLDGDGRSEAIQVLVPFGVVQLVRALVAGAVQAEFTVYRLDPPGISGATPTFADTINVALSAEEGRVDGVLPSVVGDWNGDGRRDLLYSESLKRIAFRLGVATDRGPGFGPTVARQEIAKADRACIGDFDGDGLDDAVLYDTYGEGGVHLLHNRGTLPGTRPSLEAPPAAPPRAH